MQNEAFSGGANLPGVVQPRLYAYFHRAFQVGIVEYHKHIIAAQLQRRFL